MNYKTLYTLIITVILTATGRAQTWSPAGTHAAANKSKAKAERVHHVRTDAKALRKLLFAAPHEKSGNTPTLVTLPTPDGGQAQYSVVAYNISAPGGRRTYANIRTLYGHNVERPTEQVYLDWTSMGLHATINGNPAGDYMIDPSERTSLELYDVYRLRDVTSEMSEHSCGSPHQPQDLANITTADLKRNTTGQLREYRLAVATTIEYSSFFGTTSFDNIDLVHSAVVSAINRMNAIFVRDVSVRLQLVADNDFLYNFEQFAEIDPYQSTNVFTIQRRNPEFLNEVIGEDQYDIGHVLHRSELATGVLGVAVVGSFCRPNSKAEAISSWVDPESPFFFNNVLAHEFGHQFGANHTFISNVCGGDGRNAEPASGSTIMGYAGFCDPSVQEFNDPYFNGYSIFEMNNLVRGRNCGEVIQTEDFSIMRTSPVATRYSVPAGVPFVLNSTIAAAEDAVVTYNWEQTDLAEPNTSLPQPENAVGPQFRSFPATPATERYFPRLPALLNNQPTPFEVLPTVGRTMRFRNTATETINGFGYTVQEIASVELTAVDAPTFAVTEPASGNQWSAGQTAAIRWNLGGTYDFAYFDIFTPSVDILLITDNGATQTMLAEEVENNGEYLLTVPDIITDRAWIMVRGHDRIFFNVSPLPISIVSGAGPRQVAINGSPRISFNDCDVADGTFTVDLTTASFGGADAPVQWRLTNLPSFMSVTYANPSPRAGEGNSATISGFDQLTEPFYTFRFVGRSADGRVVKRATLRRTSPLITPFANEPGFFEPVDIRPTLTAFVPQVANPSSFEFQVAEDADFQNLVFARVDLPEPSVTLPYYLEGNTTYYFRVRMVNDCVLSDWDEASFTTGDCRFYLYGGDAVTIERRSTARIPLVIEDEGTIADIDVIEFNASGRGSGRSTYALEHPGGGSTLLFNTTCATASSLYANFDDDAAEEFTDCATADFGLFYEPAEGSLSQFDDLEASGEWTLAVENTSVLFSTEIDFFGVKICYTEDFFGFFDLLTRGEEDAVALNWTRPTEYKESLVIERRPVGTDIWNTVGPTVAASKVSFTDHDVTAGQLYDYRLRGADKSGRVVYSTVAQAGITVANELSVYPNPTSGVVNYRTEAMNGQPYELLGVTGKVIARGTLKVSGELDLSAQVPGVYLLRVGEITRRMVRL